MIVSAAVSTMGHLLLTLCGQDVNSRSQRGDGENGGEKMEIDTTGTRVDGLTSHSQPGISREAFNLPLFSDPEEGA